MNSAYEICLDANSSGQVFGGSCAEPQETIHWNGILVSGEPGAEGDVFQLQNESNGGCLTAEAGGVVDTTACGTSDNQSWYGDTVLIDKANGQCLNAESDQTTLDTVACDTTYQTDSQRWDPAQDGP